MLDSVVNIADININSLMKNLGVINPLQSFTIKELMDARDPAYLKHDARTNALHPSILEKAYASTLVYKTFASGEHASTRGNVYTQKVLFKDFVVLAKDKGISLREAIEYAIKDADIHITCNCPAFLYWAYRYMATQLGYLYGIPKENRTPNRNNVGLQGTMCKHSDKALRQVIKDKKLIIEKFLDYYKRNEDVSDLLYADNLEYATADDVGSLMTDTFDESGSDNYTLVDFGS